MPKSAQKRACFRGFLTCPLLPVKKKLARLWARPARQRFCAGVSGQPHCVADLPHPFWGLKCGFFATTCGYGAAPLTILQERVSDSPPERAVVIVERRHEPPGPVEGARPAASGDSLPLAAHTAVLERVMERRLALGLPFTRRVRAGGCRGGCHSPSQWGQVSVSRTGTAVPSR